MKPTKNKLYWAIWVALNMGGMEAARGEMALDNTIAPAHDFELDGNRTYNIDANQRGVFSSTGKNVFFSFNKFAIESGNTARFYCGAGCNATNNVISRVTGPVTNKAEIFGTLKSEIGNQNGNFYLLSPNGIVFGKDAQIDVPGTFHSATTDTLKFPPDKEFGPNTTDVSSLDADPAKFGFLNKGNITIGESSGDKLTITSTTSPSARAVLTAGTVEVIGEAQAAAGSTLEIRAGADDPRVSGAAITVRSGGRITGNAGNVTLEAASPADGGPTSGSVRIESDGEVSDAGGITSENGDVVVLGKVSSAATRAGRDVSVEEAAGSLDSDVVEAGQDVKVAQGTLTARNQVSASRAVRVADGGRLTNSGDLTVRGSTVLVTGTDSGIESSNTGALAVEATGADGDNQQTHALTVAGGGRIARGANGGAATVRATRGSINVDRGSAIRDAASVESDEADVVVEGEVGSEVTTAGRDVLVRGGVLAVGRSVEASDGVLVSGGGAIEKKNAGDWTVKGSRVSVGRQSRIESFGAGTLTVQATGNDSAAGLALDLSDGGQIRQIDGGGAVTNHLTIDTRGALTLKFIGSDAGDTSSNIVKATNGNLTLLVAKAFDVSGPVSYSRNGDFSITAGAVNVNGPGTAITKAGTGNLNVTATGADGANVDSGGTPLPAALIVREGGQISGQHAGAMNIQAQAGSIVVGNTGVTAGTSRITGGNGGALTVAAAGSVSVGPAGVIEKTAGTSLTITADEQIVLSGNGQIRQTGPVGGNADLAIRSGGDLSLSGIASDAADNSAGIVKSNAGNLNIASAGLLSFANGFQYTNGGGGDVTLEGKTVRIDGHTVSSENGGALAVRATGGSLELLNGAVLAGRNTQAMTVSASGGTVSVASGAAIEKTAGTTLAVTGDRIAVDAGTLRSAGSGAFTVTATDADTPQTLAFNVTNGGRIIGDNKDATLAIRSERGSILLDGGISGNFQKATAGDVLFHAGDLLDVSGTVEHNANGNFTLEGNQVLVTGTVNKSGGTGTLTVQASGVDPANEAALAVRQGGSIRGAHSGDMKVLADTGTIEVDGANSAIKGENSGALQVGGVAGGANTQRIRVTGGGAIEKAAGTDLAVQSLAVTVQGQDSHIEATDLVSGDFTVQAAGGDVSVGAGGRIAVGKAAGMTVQASEAISVGAGGVIEKAAGSLGLNARYVAVDGTLRALDGDLNILGSVDPTAPASGGSTSAKNNINISGTLSSGVIQAEQNINVNGGRLLAGSLVSANQLLEVSGNGVLEQINGGDLTIQGRTLLLDGVSSSLLADNSSGLFRVEATGADGENGQAQALTVRNGARIEGRRQGEMAVVASNAAGSIAIRDGGQVARMVGGSGDVFRLEAGKDVIIEGNGSSLQAGSQFQGTADVAALGGDAVVGAGAAIDYRNGGTATLQAGRDVAIASGGTATLGNGGIATTRAGGELRIAGRLDHTNGADAAVLAGAAVTVDGGTLTGANTGHTLYVGRDPADTLTTPRVQVLSGGVLSRTVSGDLIVRSGSLRVDGSGSNLGLGDSTVSAALPSGRFRIEATGADGDNGLAQALTVQNGGRIEGRHQGEMAVLASNPAGSIAINDGGGIVRAAGGSSDLFRVEAGQSIIVEGNGSSLQAGSQFQGGAGIAALGGDVVVGAGAAIDYRNGGTATLQAGRDVAIASGGTATLGNVGTATTRAGGEVRIGGRLDHTNGADAAVLADAAVTVAGGTLSGANAGHTLFVGRDLADTTTTPRVQVLSGGVLSRTVSGDLIVRSGSVLVDGSGSNLGLGDSTVSAALPSGQFRIEATGADGENGLSQALTVQNGGRIEGRHQGEMAVLASDPAGSVAITDGGEIARTASASGDRFRVEAGKDVIIEGNGSSLRTGSQFQGTAEATTLGGDIVVGAGARVDYRNGGTATMRAGREVRIAGQVDYANQADAAVLAGASVTVDGGTVSGANIGRTLFIGRDPADTLTTPRVQVLNGGRLARIADGDLVVRSGSLRVDGPGSSLGIGDPTVSAGFPSGRFRIEATGADGDNGLAQALTVQNGGRIGGRHQGEMAVLASNPAGSITIKNGGQIVRAAGGSADRFQVAAGKDLLLEGDASTLQAGAQFQGNAQVAAGGDVVVGSGAILNYQNGGTATTQAGREARIAGRLDHTNRADASVFAGAAVTVDGGTIFGTNPSRTLFVGRGLAETQITPQVQILNGGQVARTIGGDLVVQSGSLLVDGPGSLVLAGDPGNSAISPNGLFRVEASGADGDNGLAQALTVRNSGRIEGRNQGEMAVLASNAAGSIAVLGGGQIARTAGGNGDLFRGEAGRDVILQGDGAALQAGPQFQGNAQLAAARDVVVAAGGSLGFSNGGTGTVQAGRDAAVAAGGTAAGGSLVAGGDINVAGALAFDTATAGRSIQVAGGRLTAGSQAVAGDAVVVNGGGIIEKTTEGDLTVTGNRVQIQGTDSRIEDTGAGTLAVSATAGDLSVSGGGAIFGRNQTGAMRISAPAGTVELGSNGTIQRFTEGSVEVNARRAIVDGLLKADNGDISVSGEAADGTRAAAGRTEASRDIQVAGTLSSGVVEAGGNVTVFGGRVIANQAVQAGGALTVSAGGAIGKNEDGDLAVTAQTISVDGTGSLISYGGTGDFIVQADGADPEEGFALSISQGGQISGNNRGDMRLRADNGSILASGETAVNAQNRGGFTIRTKVLNVVGAGSTGSRPRPAILIGNGVRTATIKANRILGDRGAEIRAVNSGNVEISPINGRALFIDPITIAKLNAQGDVTLSGRSITLADTELRLNSGGADGGNIFFALTGQDGIVDLTSSHVSNTGPGNAARSNNIIFASNFPLTYRTAGSVVETRTIPDGQGGNIGVAPLDSKFDFGILSDRRFQLGGVAEWRVVAQADPLIQPDPVQNVFAATHEFKFSENIRLSATAALQAATLSVIAQPVSKVDLDALHAGPCGKGGSSFAISGVSGFGAEPSVLLPWPVDDFAKPGLEPLSSAAPANSERPAGSPLRVAALDRAGDSDCN